LLATSDRRSAYRALLGNRNYRLWFASSLGSSLGDWAGLFALQVLVVSLAQPGSRLALFGLGGIMMARLLPSLFFGPISGVLADRYDRKRLMVTTDLARGALFLGIAFSRDLTALFLLTFFVECLSLLYASAKDASLPAIVPRAQLAEANQLNLLVTYGPLPFGAVAATAMAALAAVLRNAGIADADPAVLALLLNAATFVVAGGIIARLQLPPSARRRTTEDEDDAPLLQRLRQDLQEVSELPLVRALITGAVGVFFGVGVVVTLGPEFVRTALERPGSDWPTLMTFVGVGLLVGILLAPWLSARLRKERLFAPALAAVGGLAALIATLPRFDVTLVAGTFLGVAAGLSFVLGYTLLHEHTDDEIRGRVFGAFYTASRVAMFAALGLAPFVAGAIGRFTIVAANRAVTMSGVRITILLAGGLAFATAFSSGRRLRHAWRDDGEKSVRPPPASGPRRPHSGVFIAFEGVEGAGKSTQVTRLVEALRAQGYDVVATREPGGSPIAERIRGLLLDPNAGDIDPRTEALLYAAARAEHVCGVIAPALQAGKVVVCDRYLDSSLAYQGFGRELGDDAVHEINRWAVGAVLPDAVVLLHLDVEEGLRRVAERARRAQREPGAVPRIAPPGVDRIEREAVTFHRRVGEGYLTLARRDRGRYLVVDATGDAGTVARQVRSGLHAWLPLPPADAATDERRAAP
jgi:dTMP kinase